MWVAGDNSGVFKLFPMCSSTCACLTANVCVWFSRYISCLDYIVSLSAQNPYLPLPKSSLFQEAGSDCHTLFMPTSLCSQGSLTGWALGHWGRFSLNPLFEILHFLSYFFSTSSNTYQARSFFSVSKSTVLHGRSGGKIFNKMFLFQFKVPGIKFQLCSWFQLLDSIDPKRQQMTVLIVSLPLTWKPRWNW